MVNLTDAYLKLDRQARNISFPLIMETLAVMFDVDEEVIKEVFR